MREPGRNVRVLEVQDLGYEAAIVHVETETLLLVDAVLDQEERVDVMLRAMAQVSD